MRRLQWWRSLESLRWQQKWRVGYGSFVPEIGVRLLGRFPRLRIALALSCHPEMWNAAVCNCGRCIRSLEERRFPHVAYVTAYIKALLPVGRKREKEGILLRADDTPMYYPFFSPAPPSPDGEWTDKPYDGYVETVKERRERDSKSKGSIKSCRCVSRT